MSGSRPIEDYLDKLRRELPGGRRFKRRVLSEVEDHLREGVWHEQEGGVPALEAERRVIERFGSPRLVARRFAEDLTGGGARTAARTMLLAMFRVMVLRFLPSPALGELLGMPANGFFEPPRRRGLRLVARQTPRSGHGDPARRPHGRGFGHRASVRRLRGQRRRGHRVHVPAGGGGPRLAFDPRARGLRGRNSPDYGRRGLLSRPGGPLLTVSSASAHELEKEGPMVPPVNR